MPYKYIGRTTDFKGKTLWEILGNLKNFGVGRIVARGMFERYPEPSYIKVLKVETLATPETVTPDDVRKVRVWVERTFRGKAFPNPIILESASYKADYKLIPKDEEEAYCRTTVKEEAKVYPKSFDFPPLMKELILRDIRAEGGNTKEELKLEIVYNKASKRTKYRIAEDGEKPNVEIVMGFGKPASPSLYEGIKL
ncbi:hypothetical protein NQ315_001060 [Exocentrus adspersus]|uniref:Uncharacterized protein n=1 Tax=Exocentrus adspersus TaxID=1586481 RepID=A0AAV8WEY3_9CUCU|nr:hypothetical protein NQ315_001060 [Exocentrus adspersus]